MTKAYKKKLIEVALPLEAINAASAREKSIRHGHPSTLHLWWARRPLAACRAVLFAQLVDDPSSHPDKFPTEEAVEAERKRLFQIIEDLVKWENSTNEAVLERARAEIRKSCDGELPPVYDPFSGGGSIPLEAQRLGLPAYGSDLNPVAVMIGKAMIEYPSRFRGMEPVHKNGHERQFYQNTDGIAEDVKAYGEYLRQMAFERIGHLYPTVELGKEEGGSGTVVAWIWSRTVPSPDPAFSGVHVPIASSFLMNSKTGSEVWIEPIVDKEAKKISYEVRKNGTKCEISSAKSGTKMGRGANFFCLFSGSAITPKFVKEKAKSGHLGKVLITILVEKDGRRFFVQPKNIQQEIAFSAKPTRKPEIKLPNHSQYVGVLGYGFKTFGDLFSDRQLTAIEGFSELIPVVQGKVERDAKNLFKYEDNKSLDKGGKGAKAYSQLISLYLAFSVDRLADYGSTLATWAPGGFIRSTYSRHAIQMTWDYAECNFFSQSTGNFSGAVDWVQKAIVGLPASGSGKISQCDAQSVEFPKNTVISTDPPYYDNIPYADISDFFYGWMKKSIGSIFEDTLSTLAVPKMEELVADRMRHGSAINAERFFLDGMTASIKRMALGSQENSPATIYYAFKQSEIQQEGLSSTGWATFLTAIIETGYSVCGTWPIRTERPGRMRAVGANALANSVVLVCRKREIAAQETTRAEFVRALQQELPAAISDLQRANIAPADMPQSAIGPGMGIFSRYKAVLEADDVPMSVKTALQLINRKLDEFLNEIQGEFDSDTRFALTWFEQNGFTKGDFGIANSIAQARGIAVESVKHAGIVESSAGKVRILKRDELLEDWEPAKDTHLTIWECCQYLVRALENEGEEAAALLIKKLGSDKAEAVKDLAYCLYDICSNKRKDAKEATAYNALIAVWTDLTSMAATIHDVQGDGQTSLNL